MPAVSIITCSHNRLPYLRQAAESVERQTFRGYEWILVDDGSSDGTAEWLRARRFPGMRRVRLAGNRGVVAGRNRALALARGEWVAWLDSDDLWYPDYLARMTAAGRGARTQVVCCGYDVIAGDGRKLAPRFRRETQLPIHRAAFPRLALFPRPSYSMVRRRVFDAIGRLDGGLKHYLDDVDLFLRIYRRFGARAFAYVEGPLMAYRRHTGQASEGVGRICRAWSEGAAFSKISEKEREILLDLAYARCKHADWFRGIARAAAG